MSAGSSLPYRLRPNKAVDRELFLSLLARLAPALALEGHHYIGLGGPFLEDFRLVHARLGIVHMTCVEVEEEVHKRQLFNRPIASVECVHSSLEDYLDGHDFDQPVVVWFDYTEPRPVTEQIGRFARTVGEVPLYSVLRITLNANPGSLGKPTENLSAEALWIWRLEKFRSRLGTLFPSDLTAAGMETKTYGPSVLRALYLAVEKEVLSYAGRKVVWALSTHYADGQPMVTAALIVCAADDKLVESLVQRWCFYSPPEHPLCIDLPALSSLERLTMESNTNARERLGFQLPESKLGEDPFEVFEKFYRIYPHFSRVEL
ncbi:MAG: hypothetical protein A2091_11600 [Desulfuromonadales bacterium GWD2_61_12]|nr:MAG: hypothetical protein A2005_01265 [Desulfuromonadales bacterium GWC2_61_20]OGR34084.1 MAG: hypothetical protein A2091_11600 [Desulfuromonadales bacterium GWD2_61_12]HAD04812.1 hypothetical protein [Desulfuromonas sp.]